MVAVAIWDREWPSVAKRRLKSLQEEVARLRPDLDDVEAEIAAGHVLVNGMPRTNAAMRVPAGSSVVVRAPRTLRGLVKLRGALDAFAVEVGGRVALDAGASTGGFVQGLLEAGARRVYAVEVGYGQLLGSLRQDERVVSLERTNIADLGPELPPEPIDVVTLDLGFLALAVGVPQLDRIRLAEGADLIALVKPMPELGLPAPPTDPALIDEARSRAADGIESAGWHVVASAPSPITGSGGAVELFLHARRSPPATSTAAG
jgi:23S rRNA (cytidine1920-2'-O)/16S rRNA (cytidine1409-2'-O)-methyltransferase